MSQTRYGLPYQGSKNDIAEEIVRMLPKADVFVDAFAGGCAVAHAAMVSGKYKRVIANDITDAPQLFLNAIRGKYANETRWISREEFNAKKATDPYIGLVWSFSNNRQNYIYGRDIEPLKRAMHYAVFFNDYALLAEQGVDISEDMQEVWRLFCRHKRYLCIKRHLHVFSAGSNQLQSLQSLQSLERLQSLQSYMPLLEVTREDYESLEIPQGAVVYCDPPYAGTECGSYGGFDHERFYQWLRRRQGLTFISEYQMPDDFECLATFARNVKSSSKGSQMIAGKEERLWAHRSASWRPPRQLGLFDDCSYTSDTPKLGGQDTPKYGGEDTPKHGGM